MTLEQFLGLSAEDFAKMSDSEILAYLQPYIATSRPLEGKKFDGKAEQRTKSNMNKVSQLMNLITKANPELMKNLPQMKSK